VTTAPSGARLTLHVGLPKSGTTYLQGLMASHREELRAAGVLYPFVRREAMFRAAVEVREQHDLWGLPADGPDGIDGTWQQLLDRVREVGLPAVLSHEILAGCSPEHAARVARDVADFDEVHLVVTCRDLLRQAMGHWQEEVKNGRPWSYDEMVAALPTPAESADRELGFWRSQDLVGVLDRWSAALPGATVHVVTAPPQSGSPPDVLWRRFAEAAAIPPDALDPTDSEPGANRSLGAAQVRFLREVLVALDGRVGRPDHAHVVKRWFAQRVLAERGGEPARATPELADHLAARSAGWADAVRERGWLVHGDLADLAVVPPAPGPHPDEVPPDVVLGDSAQEVAALLLEEVAQRHAAGDPEESPGLLRRVSRRVRPGRRPPPTPRRSPGG
jgi:hypothetical protein